MFSAAALAVGLVSCGGAAGRQTVTGVVVDASIEQRRGPDRCGGRIPATPDSCIGVKIFLRGFDVFCFVFYLLLWKIVEKI